MSVEQLSSLPMRKMITPQHSCLIFDAAVLTYIKLIIIRWIFSFLFIGQELTTWPASNCLQVRILLQIIFCSCVIEYYADRFPEQAESDLTDLVEQNNGDRMMEQLLNLVMAKYRDLSVSRSSIICLSLRLRQIIDLLATDKSRYLAQLRPIINCLHRCQQKRKHPDTYLQCTFEAWEEMMHACRR